MIMILNDLFVRQNVFSKLLLQRDEKELSKELKVKIMRIRMAYSKVRRRFDEEVKEFVDELMSDEFKRLGSLTTRTEEEELQYNKLSEKINAEYAEFLNQKGHEEISDIIDDSFTLEEYSDIVDINSGNDVEINGNSIQAPDFLEIVYNLFVKE